MKLWTINKWLRKVGIVLVIGLDLNDGTHSISFCLAKTFDANAWKCVDGVGYNISEAPEREQHEPLS